METRQQAIAHAQMLHGLRGINDAGRAKMAARIARLEAMTDAEHDAMERRRETAADYAEDKARRAQ